MGQVKVMSTDFFILAITSTICGVIITLKITSFLSKHGIKINYWLLGWYIYKYLKQYRKLTIEENGKTGNLFYVFIVSWSLALVFFLIGIILAITVK